MAIWGAICMPLSPSATTRSVTLVTFVIHWVHAVLVALNYAFYVIDQEDQFGRATVDAHFTFSIIAMVAFHLVISVFYARALRFPFPEKVAAQRRLTGIGMNWVLSDIPIFFIEARMVWTAHFETPIQGVCFVWTSLSTLYSTVCVWLFIMRCALNYLQRVEDDQAADSKEKSSVPAPPSLLYLPSGLQAHREPSPHPSLPAASMKLPPFAPFSSGHGAPTGVSTNVGAVMPRAFSPTMSTPARLLPSSQIDRSTPGGDSSLI
eukprot:NODE_3444_length_974_cov_29.518919_g3166_i0.p1 GENE.NODE_3444_length_974_cov_29.518919_g3166_i0~~NODE_3444_length_974_cov_29.518919_g3166_i0.p1  ORF type:complete len:284 (+),score=55.17 NODE_3444_length_974_cov_29.518919_g3166_i0:66-854(+)